MAASLDGFIARKDGGVDWMDTTDVFNDGEELGAEAVEAFLQSIDCYVMGSRTYEAALSYESRGLGWAYGDKPVFVLTTRALPKNCETIEFVSGDLERLFQDRLRPAFRNIWVAGGGVLAGDVLRRGLADEVRYSILPVLIGDGLRFFEDLNVDVRLHLLEIKAYRSGIVALRHSVHRACATRSADLRILGAPLRVI